MTAHHPQRRLLSAGLAIAASLLACLAFITASGTARAAPLFGASADAPAVQVEQSLDYLLDLVGDQRMAFQPEKVRALLDFIAYQAKPNQEYEMKRRDGLNGACLALNIQARLERILRYVYNPDIPTFTMYPTVVRRSSWRPGSEILTTRRHLWRMPANLTEPVVLRGEEFEEITPNVNSGGYYSYDLERLLILTPFENKAAFISISKQKGPSSVGKKGAAINGGKDWTFVYTREEGLTSGGVGWMDTFMYDSFSITVYIGLKPDRPLTRYGVFSWLKAGWAGINVIKSKHIYEGCQRAAHELKRLMESTRLPGAEKLADKVEEVRSMSDAEMLRKLEPLSQALADMDESHPVLSEDEFAEILEQGHYAEKLSREERASLLIKEYLKKMMGKPSFLDRER